jgi:hypothetical protein
MPQAVTVYRWDDPGAPQIGSTDYWPGILNILKKCLVEGYGTKAAAGWTVEYEDGPGNKCVFRNDPVEGSGGYVQFQKQSNAVTWFKGAASMTAIDTFIHQGYMQGINLSTAYNNGIWILIASKTAFYLTFGISGVNGLNLASNSANPSHFTIFVGDIVGTVKNDPGMFVARGRSTGSFTAASTDTAAGFNNELSGIFGTSVIGATAFGQNALNVAGNVSVPLRTNGEVTADIYQPIRLGVNFTSPIASVPVGKILISPVYLGLVSVIASTVTNRPVVRGNFPGLYSFNGTWYLNDTWPLIVPLDGKNYLMQKQLNNNTNQNGGANHMIDITSWEKPNRD